MQSWHNTSICATSTVVIHKEVVVVFSGLERKVIATVLAGLFDGVRVQSFRRCGMVLPRGKVGSPSDYEQLDRGDILLGRSCYR